MDNISDECNPSESANLNPQGQVSESTSNSASTATRVGFFRGLILGQWTQRWVFRHFESVFAGDPQKVALAKAVWLTRRGQQWSNWGGLLKARAYLAEAIAIKDDYLPAYVALVAVYRETAVRTGIVSLLWRAREILETLPRKTLLLGREVGLEQCGGAVHAQWGELLLVLRQRDEAENHFLLALQCHQRAQSLGQDLRAFLQDVGCWVSPGFESYLRGRLEGLRVSPAW